MSVVLINYATPEFRLSQNLNLKSGLEVAGFDRTIGYRTKDIDPQFYRQNHHILNQPRGAGYWLWKPYFILLTLKKLKPGDFLFYSDAGSVFLQPISYLIDIANDHDRDVLVFDTRFPERQWTKRDAFILMDCDRPEYTDTLQRGATFSLWRHSEHALAIAEQVLSYCRDARIITDQANVLGEPDYPEFHQNRHDQSVLSLVTKSNEVPSYRPLHSIGNSLRDRYPDSTYPQMMTLTRKQNSSLMMRFSRKWEWALRRFRSSSFTAG